ncbi:MAG TPA: redoxin domain-containing protein [Povalibacter sp.]|uniref:redoxin domain-containing protein n=1 Tax=Povalibacter sp. TaxID=1962978 RepID=UPI002D05A7A6|nr:redoxin domain-containing protein [Povalibacter sp.]HMN46673.1 redoxin domain-containing protein [Povalibacter sp.]
MSYSRTRIAFSLAALSLSSAASALQPGDVVDNFRLTDHKGVSHEFYYLSDAKAVVLMTQGNGCDASRTSAAMLESLRSKYPNVEFLLLNANLGDTREAIVKETAANNISLPVLIDETQIITESLGATRNGEVFVVDPRGWKVAYRGAVSGAAAAIDAVSSGSAVSRPTTAVTGCAIKMPERDRSHANISYEKTIAPMLQEKCVTCHRDGGIGPWQMSSYEMVRGFSPMIREVVRTQRMPPWHADPHYGHFSNDRALSDEQVKTLVHWIEAGAPRGAGEDPLKTQKKDWPKWPLGEPDLVIETPAFTTPATGVIPYQMVQVKNPLDHDVWIRAIDYLPGQRAVLHHVIASAGGERRGATSLYNYVPGAEPLEIPPDNGILLKAGTTIHFQMHFTPNGQELTDVTKLGLYFMKDPPKFSYRSMIFAQPRLKIPANTKVHTEMAEQTFKEDAVIYSLHPHAHFRGKSSSFVARYPDGREETLLNVPNYDFNWQSTYDLVEPLPVPAGTKVVYTQVFDNSSQNKANPDPNRTVTWGEQTWDEMVFGVIRYRNVKEDKGPEKPTGPSQEELFGATAN